MFRDKKVPNFSRNVDGHRSQQGSRRLVAMAGDLVSVPGHVLPNLLRFVGYVLIPILKSQACIETRSVEIGPHDLLGHA